MNLEQMRIEIQEVRAEIEKAISERQPMEKLQELINLENELGNKIVQNS